MITGFAIGKFYPFHLGHMYLLDVAQANCDHLIVWVCDKSQQSIRGTVRAGWIRELYPNVQVSVVPDTLEDNDSKGWAEYTLRGLGKAPDVVFTSEDYGEVFARFLGSKHILVDRRRVCVPVSGTAIRANPYTHWQYLPPLVRAHYTKRIVCVGAESTGTTTLAESLAQHYQTVWVPEYGREFYLRKQATGETAWQTEEFVHIAIEQSRREDEAARNANCVLIADTDAFATTLWHERYLNFMSPQVQKIADARKCDLYLLTGNEIPFVQDGARDGEHIRHKMHERFEEELTRQRKRYILVQGDVQERLRAAIAAVDRIIQTVV
jgi:HTH-type transcriptional regulator, transcriptional repressor of NAD biosynthesis genes